MTVFYDFWDGESVSGIRFYPYDLDFPVPEVVIPPFVIENRKIIFQKQLS